MRCAAFLLLVLAPAVSAQQLPGDPIVLDVLGTRRVIGPAELQTLPLASVTTSFGGSPQVFTGIPLVGVLELAGLDSAARRGPGLANTVLVEATDAYRVAFGIADLDSAVTGRVLLLAFAVDGRPLPARDGPWRLVAGGDRHARRSVRQVTAVRVIEAPARSSR
jgi:DMSO/TMAO reductase YedYZ molybdopterin-dependent catalytic subunit